MSAIDKLVSATQAIMGEPVCVEIEHIGQVWVKSCVSAAERGRIHEISKSEGTFNGMVEEIIVRAKDKDGNPIFSKEDKLKMLREVDAEMISAIYNKVRGIDFRGKS